MKRYILKIIKWITFSFVALIIATTIIIIYLCYYPEKFYEWRAYFNSNTIVLHTKNGIDKNSVNIYWKSDYNAGQIIKNGKSTPLLFKEHGVNNFIICYKKDTIKTFSYGKTNNWHGHEHIITLSKNKNEKINTIVEVNGPDTRNQKF